MTWLLLLQMFRLLWLYSALYDLTGTGSRGPKYPFPEPWRLALGQIAVASPFAVVGGGSETTGMYRLHFNYTATKCCTARPVLPCVSPSRPLHTSPQQLPLLEWLQLRLRLLLLHTSL